MRRISMLGLIPLVLLAAACSSTSSTSVQSVQPRRPVLTSLTSSVGTIGVPASNYQVVVSASGICFVQAAQGTNGVMVADHLSTGQTASFSAKNGRASVILGSVRVKVDVQIDGKKIWQYTPTNAPLSLHFHSVS
jgi:hypothetical protein